MPNIFNLLSFFRHVPNSLLERFFLSFPAFAGFDWSAVTERRVEPVLDRCHTMLPAECARLGSGDCSLAQACGCNPQRLVAQTVEYFLRVCTEISEQSDVLKGTGF